MYCDGAFECDGLVRPGRDGCGYEFEPLVRLEIEESRDDPFTSFDSGVRFLDDDGDELHLQEEEPYRDAHEDGEEREEQLIEEEEFGSKKKYVNAVEKARLKENAKTKRLERAGSKAGLTVLQMKQNIARRNSCSDPALAFRSPNRSRQTNFKQYTLPDYRRQNQFGYIKLGSLGHKDNPELVFKRQALQRIKEFGRHARSCNTMSHPNPALANPKKSPKPSSRKVALDFASSIPKPKVKITKESSKENMKKVLPVQNHHTLTDLQILEMKHQSHKEHVEAIRRDLEHFLR
ncbi:hypothetical protein R1flu_018004 [Riccia fluitans]|uniref:Uncharacterized protein n=1 Tax=Riccia fluitans TaxID=41844 RepID=A0ABD1ZEK1_9MARC